MKTKVFYFKVNSKKIENPVKLENQIENVCNWLIKRHNITCEKINLKAGLIEAEFIENKFTLQAEFD